MAAVTFTETSELRERPDGLIRVHTFVVKDRILDVELVFDTVGGWRNSAQIAAVFYVWRVGGTRPTRDEAAYTYNRSHKAVLASVRRLLTLEHPPLPFEIDDLSTPAGEAVYLLREGLPL